MSRLQQRVARRPLPQTQRGVSAIIPVIHRLLAVAYNEHVTGFAPAGNAAGLKRKFLGGSRASPMQIIIM
jgi:hypothetical protein